MKINNISKVAIASLMVNTAICSQEAEKDVNYNAFPSGDPVNHYGYHHGDIFSANFWRFAERQTKPISLEEGGNGLFVLNIEGGSSSFTRIFTAGLAFDTLEDALSLQKPLRNIYVKNFGLTPEDFDALCNCIEAQKEDLRTLSFSGIEMTAEQLETLVKVLEGIQHPESFSMEFNNVSFTGPTIDSSIATLICHGFVSLKVNKHNNDHRYAGTLRSALTEMVSKGTKIVGDLLLGTEFEIYAGERVCFWGSLKQTDLSWLDIIPNLMDTMPNLETLELNNCGPDFIEKLAECLSAKLVVSQEATIPFHIVIDEWEQTGEIIEAAFQLPVSNLDIRFRQATDKGRITPSWDKCFENEALENVELCFAFDICPIEFWEGLTNFNALKNLEQLKIRMRNKRDSNLGWRILYNIICTHNNLKVLDIPNLRAEEATDKFWRWYMEYQKKHPITITLCNAEDSKNVDTDDVLWEALETENFSL